MKQFIASSCCDVLSQHFLLYFMKDTLKGTETLMTNSQVNSYEYRMCKNTFKSEQYTNSVVPGSELEDIFTLTVNRKFSKRRFGAVKIVSKTYLLYISDCWYWLEM